MSENVGLFMVDRDQLFLKCVGNREEEYFVLSLLAYKVIVAQVALPHFKCMENPFTSAEIKINEIAINYVSKPINILCLFRQRK